MQLFLHGIQAIVFHLVFPLTVLALGFQNDPPRGTVEKNRGGADLATIRWSWSGSPLSAAFLTFAYICIVCSRCAETMLLIPQSCQGIPQSCSSDVLLPHRARCANHVPWRNLVGNT